PSIPDRAVLSLCPLWAVARLQPGEATYAPMCYADGGLVDDTFVYRLPDSWLLVVNAANLSKDLSWMQYHAPRRGVEIADRSEETAMLALQGPQAAAIMDLIAEGDVSSLARNRIATVSVLGVELLVSRTGYTGEDGFELYLPADRAVELWRGILAAGAPLGLLPIGLGARDSLRFEPCFPLYGHELGPELTPLQAGLGWAVALRKGNFIGRESLLKERVEGVPRRLVGFEMVEKGVPRQGMRVHAAGVEIGWVTSGLFAPTLDKFLGMAYLPPDLAAVGTEIAIDIRGQLRAARVVKRPFYTPAYQNS
ncbi:MAG: glycine cleavage system aminomethyltransferase GcvT, partial [Chloroflexi bacterium]|nr:glycine cleavage system aminomethyltransferase GcvT [Chloroflexota bacterium]